MVDWRRFERCKTRLDIKKKRLPQKLLFIKVILSHFHFNYLLQLLLVAKDHYFDIFSANRDAGFLQIFEVANRSAVQIIKIYFFVCKRNMVKGFAGKIPLIKIFIFYCNILS